MISPLTYAKGTTAFSNEDLSAAGSAYKNAMYLTVICLQKYAPFALVDNGSAVNVYPWRTAKILGIKEDQLPAPSTNLRAYGNLKGLLLGTALLPINISPNERNTEFKVLDIPATFNCSCQDHSFTITRYFHLYCTRK